MLDVTVFPQNKDWVWVKGKKIASSGVKKTFGWLKEKGYIRSLGL